MEISRLPDILHEKPGRLTWSADLVTFPQSAMNVPRASHARLSHMFSLDESQLHNAAAQVCCLILGSSFNVFSLLTVRYLSTGSSLLSSFFLKVFSDMCT